MLLSLVSTVAANMILVQYNSAVPVSLACSTWIGNSPDHGIIGTMFLVELDGLQSRRQWCKFKSSRSMKRTGV